MNQFFTTLPRNLLDCFKGRMLLWHLLFIVLTFILVQSGFDWFYFSHTRSPVLRKWMFPSAPIGGLVPFAIPLALILTGTILRTQTARIGWALGQAALLGSLISSTYKAFTGRYHPTHNLGTRDITHEFQFGFMRGGVFWGWPSSHTTIAFAMAVTVFTLFPKRRWLGGLALAYAGYIGLGVSMTIHWFSDFAAGAILGTVIGLVVGKSFTTAGSAQDIQTKVG